MRKHLSDNARALVIMVPLVAVVLWLAYLVFTTVPPTCYDSAHQRIQPEVANCTDPDQ